MSVDTGPEQAAGFFIRSREAAEEYLRKRGRDTNIIYHDTIKDLPAEKLYHLFFSAGWAGTEGAPDPEMLKKFNIPFINSTLVISAWEKERLVGAVRVLSDTVIRSVIYDLVVDPEYQNKGIGKELVRRCIEHFPDSEWLVQTEKHLTGFYEKIGFRIYRDVVLTIPSLYQPAGQADLQYIDKMEE